MSKSVTSILAKSTNGSVSAVVDQRQSYLDAARRFYGEAKEAAEAAEKAAADAKEGAANLLNSFKD